MNRIEQAIMGLPKDITCFVLEIGKPGNVKLTKTIGHLLIKNRPLSVLFSFADYSNAPERFKKLDEQITFEERLESNVLFFNQTKEYFLKYNNTKFNLIFAHNSVDLIPFSKFLTDNGKSMVVSTLEISEVLSDG